MAPLLMEEVWEIILRHARRPIPPPLTTDDRETVRQPELAALMRTCAYLNRLTSSILYSAPAIDDPIRFIQGYDKPPANPEVPNKVVLLNLVRRLHLEYPDFHETPTYYHLIRFSEPYWDDIGIHRHNKKVIAAARYHNFTDRLSNFVSSSLHNGTLFPILWSISLCSIFGHPSETFMPSTAIDLEYHMVLACRLHLWRFIKSVPVQHVCAHNGESAMCIPWNERYEVGKREYPTTFHLHLNDINHPPAIVFDRRTIWDYRPHSSVPVVNWDIVDNTLDSALHLLVHHGSLGLDCMDCSSTNGHGHGHGHEHEHGHRHGHGPARPNGKGSTGVRRPLIDLDIHATPITTLSSPQRARNLEHHNGWFTVDAHTKIAQARQVAIEKKLGFGNLAVRSARKDRIAWKSSVDSPICPACEIGPIP